MLENPISSNRGENRCPLFIALHFKFWCACMRWRTSTSQKDSNNNYPSSRLDPELLQFISVAPVGHLGSVLKRTKVIWYVINSNFLRL